MMYDYLIVGSGLFGSVFAYEANKRGKKVLVIDQRNHVGGNIYTEVNEGINIHKYGAHIFHTSNDNIWEYINKFSKFNRFTNSPMAVFKDEIYNLPFNMNTFSKLWNIKTPSEAKKIIEEQRKEINYTPTNLEEQAIKLAGRDIYEKFIKGYTEKQWGRKCTELPPFIIRRLPVRFTYDNNYFNDTFQGIPIGGYTNIIDNMLHNIEIRLNTNFFDIKDKIKFKKVIYTGKIDEYFDYQYGKLDYRSLYFKEEVLDIENYQGNAVINYNQFEVPYTRIIEHKHFENSISDKTIITKEYPCEYNNRNEPYYPINDSKNNELYNKYEKLAKSETNVIFGGRLGLYKYFDMDDIIEKALLCVDNEFN